MNNAPNVTNLALLALMQKYVPVAIMVQDYSTTNACLIVQRVIISIALLMANVFPAKVLVQLVFLVQTNALHVLLTMAFSMKYVIKLVLMGII